MIGSRVTYKCNKGRYLEVMTSQKVTSICNEDGRWYPNPSIFICKLATCHQPQLKLNMQISDDDVTDLTVGSSIEVSCLKGFHLNTLRHHSRVVCSTDYRWVPPFTSLTCLRQYDDVIIAL